MCNGLRFGFFLAICLGVTALVEADPLEDLQQAAMHNDAAVLERLLKANSELVNAVNRSEGRKPSRTDYYAPLHFAADWGHNEAVRLLIAYGANVNCGALGLAAQRGHKTVVELLLDHKADPNTKGGEMELTPLHLAAEHGRLEVTELLIKAGANVNAKSCFLSTPLHKATTKDVAQLLLDHGAAIEAMPLRLFSDLA